MSPESELKINELLLSLKGELNGSIVATVQRKVEYAKTDEEKIAAWEYMEAIADPSKWDYYGIMKKEDQKVMKTLEYILNDGQEKPHYISHHMTTKKI